MAGPDQCTVPDPLAEADREYEARMKEMYEKAQEYSNDSPDLPGLIDQYEATDAVTNEKVRQYKRRVKQIKKTPQTITYSQQQKDSEVVDRQRRAQLVLWSLAAAAVLGFFFVVLRRK